MSTYDAIKDGEFLTLDEQIAALKEYLPNWDGTLQGLADEAYVRMWDMNLYFDFCGPGACCTLSDYSGKTQFLIDEDGDPYPPRIGHGKWGGTNWLYAAIRAWRKALHVPEYEQSN